MATTTSSFPELLKKDAYKWFWESYDVLPKVHPMIFKERMVETLYERSTSAVGTGLLIEKGETEAIEERSPIEGFVTLGKVRSWGKRESVSKELHDDPTKLANFMKSQMPQWAKDVVETQETFYADVFNKGGLTAGHAIFNNSIPNVLDDSTGNLIYDSKPLFNLSGNDRSSKGGGTYYNGLGLSFSKTNLITAYNLMSVTNNRKEDDTKMAMSPNAIIANPSLKFDIDEVLNSPDDPSTANRAINTVASLVKPIYWHYLTDTDQWTLARLQFGLEALKRMNPEFDMWEDKETKNYQMSVFTRFGVMVNNWRGLVSSNFSTS